MAGLKRVYGGDSVHGELVRVLDLCYKHGLTNLAMFSI